MISLARRRMLLTSKKKAPERITIPIRGQVRRKRTRTVPSEPKVRPKLGVNHR